MSRYELQRLWEEDEFGRSIDHFDLVTPKDYIDPICKRCRGALLTEADDPSNTERIAHERYGRVPDACRMGSTGYSRHHCCPYTRR